ncbi:hypothetical protein [Candidatus Liberibacter solanacearum]|nr:hypothetical protein [Candidatus Liberibacter solanacearum]
MNAKDGSLSLERGVVRNCPLGLNRAKFLAFVWRGLSPTQQEKL